MRKRLRKKKRIGEFQEKGFAVRFTFEKGMDDDYQISDKFLDFLDMCEPKLAMAIGTGDGEHWEFVVGRKQRYVSTYDGDRTKVFQWLVAQPEILSVKMTDSWDLWYADEEMCVKWDEKYTFTKENS